MVYFAQPDDFGTASFFGRAAIEVHVERSLLSASELYRNLMRQVLRSFFKASGMDESC